MPVFFLKWERSKIEILTRFRLHCLIEFKTFWSQNIRLFPELTFDGNLKIGICTTVEWLTVDTNTIHIYILKLNARLIPH